MGDKLECHGKHGGNNFFIDLDDSRKGDGIVLAVSVGIRDTMIPSPGDTLCEVKLPIKIIKLSI